MKMNADRYAERSTRERIVHLETTLPPKEAVRAFLGEIVERSIDGDRRGCLLVNTALETASHDSELGAEVTARFGEIEAFFRRAGRGLCPVQSRCERSRPHAARRVLARLNPQRELLEGVVRPALALLD